MSEGKGKGKANAEETHTTNGTKTRVNGNGKGLLERVADSAAGLAKSTFSAPNVDEVNDASRSSLAGGQKAQASRAAGTSAWAENRSATQQSNPSAGQAAQSSATSAFPRSTHQGQHTAAAEAEFSAFLDDAPMLSAPDTTTTTFDQAQLPILDAPSSRPSLPTQRSAQTHYPGNLNWIYNNTLSRTPQSQSQSLSTALTIPQQEALDGADVLAILTDTSSKEPDYFEPQTIEQEIEDWRLTPAQLEMVKALANELAELFPGSATLSGKGGVDVAHPANLQPKAFSDEEVSKWLPEEYAQESYMAFGEVLEPGEASQRWIEAWEGVLGRYNEEVWGDLEPLVREARREVEEMKGMVEGVENYQPKALRRLGLVLGHFRGGGA